MISCSKCGSNLCKCGTPEVIVPLKSFGEPTVCLKCGQVKKAGYFCVCETSIDPNTPNGRCCPGCGVFEGWKHLPGCKYITTFDGQEVKELSADPVNPSHYDGDECMKTIEHITKDLNGTEGYLTGVILKYLWRWKRKNGVEDLKKIRWYLDRLISHLGG